MTEKLSKKERKAAKFKEAKKGKDATEETAPVEQNDGAPDHEASKSSLKRKRSDKGDEAAPAAPKKPKAPPRFILFVGNLPYDLTAEDLTKHFEKASPNAVRMRKGFAFMEFEGDEASKNLHVALRFHHTLLKNRKINVELTAGGGGNSAKRRQKLTTKNAALKEELSERVETEKMLKSNSKKEREESKKAAAAAGGTAKKSKPKSGKPEISAADLAGIHPDRLKNLS